MINFFRKIRKKLADENKPLKYARYAFGEILLVVIGILIALQINNWNEHQKELKQEKVIMSNLNNEIIKNNKLLNKHRIQYQEVKKSINFLMSLMGQSENEIAKYNIDSLLYIAIDVYDFRPTENVFSEIIASGKLDLITSDSLKNALFEWTAGLKVKEEAVEGLDHMTQNSFIPYLTKNGSLKNIDSYGFLQWKEKSRLKSNNLKLFSQNEFENILDNHAWSVTSYKNTLDSLQIISQKIIRLTKSKKE